MTRLPIYSYCARPGGPWASEHPCKREECRFNLLLDREGMPYLKPADTCCLRAVEDIERDERWLAPHRALGDKLGVSADTSERVTRLALMRYAHREGSTCAEAETRLRASGALSLLGVKP